MKVTLEIDMTKLNREALIEYFTKNGDNTEEELDKVSDNDLVLQFIVYEVQSNFDYEDTGLSIINGGNENV